VHKISGLLLSVVALFALSGYSSCDPILENNGFDLWCGADLCYWKIDRGNIRKAPTWHGSDLGVEFVGDDVSISQASDNVPRCMMFSLVADVAPEVDVTLLLDIQDDGSIDAEERIPSSSWAPIEILIDMPPRFDERVRFVLEKTGAGHAVLAQIQATEAPCPVPVQLGELCTEDGVCASGHCVPFIPGLNSIGSCGECADSSQCSGEDVCGLDVPESKYSYMHAACGSAARHGLAELCIEDGECVTGVCCEGVCSTCCAEVACSDGESCSHVVLLAGSTGPRMCAPGAGAGSTGEACLTAADCASGTCAGGGELRLCNGEGRPCSNDADCAPGCLFGFGCGGNQCMTVGTAGGTCQ
jgi:hypothetical protein